MVLLINKLCSAGGAQVFLYKALALIMPTLLVAPRHAGMLIVHRHCDASAAHLHQFHQPDLDAWGQSHNHQRHFCERSGDTLICALQTGFDCHHDTPILVLPLNSEQFIRPLPVGGLVPPNVGVTPFAMGALPSLTRVAVLDETLVSSTCRADLSTLDATAALLQRGHALLL